MMTKGRYIELAADLRIDRALIKRRSEGATQTATLDGFDMAVETLVSNLKRDNPNFDKARFIAAVEKP